MKLIILYLFIATLMYIIPCGLFYMGFKDWAAAIIAFVYLACIFYLVDFRKL